jgi:Relaxase/Mobilisation nuclease domain/Large polyvalent protein-associated domain 7
MLAPIAGSRRDGKSSFRTLTRYLTEGRDPVTDEIVERGEHLLSDNLLSRETAAAEMRAVGFENPRVTDPVYHYQLCWRPGERPIRAQWEEAARKTIQDLWFGEHQFLVVAHDDREHFHVHVLINRIHPETYRAHYPAFSKRGLDKSLREIEHAQGWKPSPGLCRWDAQLARAIKNSREDMAAYRERAGVGRVAQKVEHFQDAESLEAYAKGAPAKKLRDLLRQGGQDWQDVHVLLKNHGLELGKAEQGGYTVRAIDSELRVKASSVFRENFSGRENRAQIEKQLGDWDPPNRYAQVRTAEETYQPQPKRDTERRTERRAERAADRARLKGEYRQYRTEAGKSLAKLRQRASEELRKLGAAHRAKRAEVKTLNVGSIEKRAIRSVLAAEAVRERAAVKLRLDEDRAARQPNNYRDWIAERAAQGDAAAISQLRGFLYQDRRRAQENGHHAGELSIQGAGGGEWREWSDAPDITNSLRRHRLFADLQTLQGKVDQRTGHVSYLIDGKQTLLDVGQKIHLLDQREATVLAGLEMAVQKFGMRLEITRADGQKKQIALTAAKHGMRVEFMDPVMQQDYQHALQFDKGRGMERGPGGIER